MNRYIAHPCLDKLYKRYTRVDQQLQKNILAFCFLSVVHDIANKMILKLHVYLFERGGGG